MYPVYIHPVYMYPSIDRIYPEQGAACLDDVTDFRRAFQNWTHLYSSSIFPHILTFRTLLFIFPSSLHPLKRSHEIFFHATHEKTASFLVWNLRDVLALIEWKDLLLVLPAEGITSKGWGAFNWIQLRTRFHTLVQVRPNCMCDLQIFASISSNVFKLNLLWNVYKSEYNSLIYPVQLGKCLNRILRS